MKTHVTSTVLPHTAGSVSGVGGVNTFLQEIENVQNTDCIEVAGINGAMSFL